MQKQYKFKAKKTPCDWRSIHTALRVTGVVVGAVLALVVFYLAFCAASIIEGDYMQ